MGRKIATLGSVWEDFAVRRRTQVRDWKNEEGRWELYIAPDPIARIPLTKLARRDAKAWLARMQRRGLSVQTVKNALTLLRVVLHDAVELELIAQNPAGDVRVHRSQEARTHETWTILDPDEQIALLRSVAGEERDMVAFALSTGLRSSELWSLRAADIDLDARLVTVRYSKNDKPPKGGKLRRVPLFGVGLDAARVAVERGKVFAWPSPRTGERRYPSSHPSRWESWLAAAHITRRVRFYDLRHTCATSLLAGWWGRKWSVDEVRQMLGHSSIKVTERYAHLVDETLWRAGRATAGIGTESRTEAGASYAIRTHDLRFTNASGDEGFQLLARRALLERYEGPHAKLADTLCALTAAALHGLDVSPGLVKAYDQWEEARHAG